jgi:hypothetical protein
LLRRLFGQDAGKVRSVLRDVPHPRTHFGRLEVFDASKNVAVLEYDGFRLPVFTELLAPFNARLNSLYMCLGEMQRRSSVISLSFVLCRVR